MAKKRPFNLKSRIKSALRTLSVQWPPKSEARNLARVYVEEGTYKNGNPIKKAKYRCASCSQLFNIEQTQMDHIEPVEDIQEGFKDWNTFIDRLFVPADKYACLCESCHSTKTKLENEVRKQNRKKVKKKS